MKRIGSTLLLATLLLAASLATALAQQRPAARVSALGELETTGGEPAFVAVWLDADGGAGTVSVTDRVGSFRGAVREARVEGGAALLSGDGVLIDAQGGREVTFTARLTRGSPPGFSITYRDTDGPGRTVEGRLSADDVQTR